MITDRYRVAIIMEAAATAIQEHIVRINNE